MLRWISLTVLIIVLMNGLSDKPVKASDETTSIPAVRLDVESGIFILLASKIKTAEMMWSCCNRKILTKDEVNILVAMLKKVQKYDISQFTGPAPKGGPIRIILLLKSNEKLTLILLWYEIQIGERRIYLPEFHEFSEKIRKRSIS